MVIVMVVIGRLELLKVLLILSLIVLVDEVIIIVCWIVVFLKMILVLF